MRKRDSVNGPRAGGKALKYAIMSDAHANPRALAAALADAERQGCGKYVLLGDVTGYGYDVVATLKMVRERFDVVLMGNHDSACAGLEPLREVLAISNYDLDRAQRGQLADEDVAWIRGRGYVHVERGMAMTHGDFTEPKAWNYVFDADEAARNFSARRERLMFCGHTHHAAVWEETAEGRLRERFVRRFGRPAAAAESATFALRRGSRYLVNVGSVGYPRNDLCCSYGIYDAARETVTVRRLPFDFRGYVLAMLERRVRLPAWLCELLAAASGGEGAR